MQLIALCLIVVGLAALAAADSPSPSTAPSVRARLADSLAPHPRLLLGRGGEELIARRVAEEPRLAKLRDRVLALADLYVAAPPIERKLTGRRLLHVSRDALHRIATMSLAYRLTADRKYLQGATATMTTVAAFSDFNPSHFLDVAEMTAALAIGYDWLHADLPEPARAAVRAAIVDKGLRASITTPPQPWIRGGNNWNQVCNGGMTLGALAVAEDEPELARRILERSIDGVPVAMKTYAPDGAYPEGAAYWEYGTTYNLLMIAALESALGTDFGLTDQPGFLKSADFRLHLFGPSGRVFSYSDGSEKMTTPAAAAFYLAGRRKDPSLLFADLPLLDTQLTKTPSAKTKNSFDWLVLIWAGDRLTATPPKATHYAGAGITPVAVHRSGWTREATFVAVKGGTVSASHGQMDVGSFALDAAGVRWAGDLGAQEYHSLESRGVQLWSRGQGAPRWQIYRLGVQPHNILTVNGLEQIFTGMATILKTTETYTVIDTGPAYAGQLAGATRGVMLRADRSVRIQDDVRATPDGLATPPTPDTPNTASTPASPPTPTTMPVVQSAPAPAVVRWAMLTEADVVPNGATATLTEKGQTLHMRVVSPAGATIKIVSTVPPRDYDVANPGTRLVTFDVALKPGEAATLAVDFTPESVTPTQTPVIPLTDW